MQRLDAHARTLDLPCAAAVAPAGEADVETYECSDERDVITVLAKSSDHVFLRDKEPILARIRPRASVTLILPSSWRL